MKRFAVHFIVGARPNFIKIAPILRRIDDSVVESVIVHTGQHYDYEMSQIFFEELEIPKPDFYLGVGSGSHGIQTGRIMIEYDKQLDESPADMIVVFGDVNSTLGCALVGVKRHIPIAHIEAGLRSFDKSMPEEINRVLCDHISELLFVTEESGMKNLANEGIPHDKCHLVGNVMVEELNYNMQKIDEKDISQLLDGGDDSYCLMTLHRPVNVDSKEALIKNLDIIEYISGKLQIIIPLHPRTRKSLSDYGLWDIFSNIENIKILEPQGFLSFMALLRQSEFVITDSGGIQSEAAFLGIPCITLRKVTEHLITIENDFNRLTKCEMSDIAKAVDWALNKTISPADKVFRTDVSGEIVEIILNYMKDKRENML